MKVNIQKLAGGGFATFTPILRPAPLATSTAGGSSSTTEAETSKSFLEKEVFKALLKDGGLTNDVNQFAADVNKLSQDVMSGGDVSSSISQFAKINEIHQHNIMWKQAVDVSQKSGGLNEVAVGNSGEVYTRSAEGKIKAISMGDYHKQQSSNKAPQLMSVSELLNARQYDPQLVGNQGVFTVAENSIGISKITDQIKDLIGTIGYDSQKSERFYSKDQVNQQLGQVQGKNLSDSEKVGLQSLMEIANTPGDHFKVISESKTNTKHMKEALSYIWKSLNKPAQLKLQATALLNGETDPKNFIVEMLTSSSENESVSKISPEKDPMSTGGSGDGSGSGSTVGLNQFQLFHKDKLTNTDSTFAFNDPKLSVMFRSTIGGVAPIMTAKGESVGMTTVQNILTGADYGAIVDTNKVYFGTSHVDASNLNNIIYDGQDAAKVYMPIGIGGGPDYEAFKKFKDINAVYEANKDSWTVKQSQDYFTKNGFNIQFDERYEDGRKVKVMRENASVKPFLVMYGYTNDATPLTKNNDWITKLTSDEEKAWLPRFENVWTVGTGKSMKNLTPDTFGPEDYYKGMIAIPYRKEATAVVDAMVGKGPKERQTSMVDVQRNLNYSSNQSLNTQNSGAILNGIR